MTTYPKIHSLFKRDHDTGKLIMGNWTLDEFDFLQYVIWEFTEKVDGANIRIMSSLTVDGDSDIGIGGRKDGSGIPPYLATKLGQIIQERIQPRMSEELRDKPFCLYGEGYGKKIQKVGGLYIPDGVDFVLFDVKIGEWWLKREDVQVIGDQLGLKVVPIVGEGTVHDAIKMMEDGLQSRWGDFPAEGLVIRPKVELFGRDGMRIMAKVKAKDFRK